MFALTAGSTALIYLNHTAQMLSFCDEAEKVVTDEVLGPFALNVCVYQWRGAAHILVGDFELGLDFCKPGNEFWEVSGGGVCTAMMRSWIVLGLLGLGRVEDARVMNSGNIAHCRSTGDRYMEPECLRLQGEISLLADPKKTDAAERYFRDAISLAQAHGAGSWELRASMSLARLLGDNDRHTEATACLEPVLQGFNEGFGTADLIAARALVESLS